MPRTVYPIPAKELRERFNAQDFPGRAARREVTPRAVKSWPADGSAGLPPNTFTIITEWVVYRDGRLHVLAETHHYQQRGGAFKTQPDPKKLVDGDAIYIIDPGE
jgi:hypothetical protein